jgi:HSP20 family protein
MSNMRLFFDPLTNESLEPNWRGFFAPLVSEGGKEAGVPKIRIDVEQHDKTYLVHADIPGVKKEDITVRIDGNYVRIDAETRRQSEVKEKGQILRSERVFGTASRAFTLAHEVDEAKATAKYDNGVLSLSLPIQESTGSKRLTVQ